MSDTTSETLKPKPCARHQWRLIECKNDIDTLECQVCHERIYESCSFDDDYA